MLAVRNTHPHRTRTRGSEPRRAFHPSRLTTRRGSDRRKVLHTPGSRYIRARGGGSENILERISSSGSVLYLHHDQQGSTRLLTGEGGKVEATFTYSAYGELTGSTGSAKTPLGYDGQYTNSDTGLSDTGLIYMRARVYNPKTAQFLSVDPLVASTRAPYTYAEGNLINRSDPGGLSWQLCVGATASFGVFTVGGEACYVSTPAGSGLAGTGSTCQKRSQRLWSGARRVARV